MEKRKRRYGDRPDGRKIRSLPPMNKVEPYIMPVRNGASNIFRDSIDIEPIEEFIKEQRAAGLKGFGIMHVIIAAYLRAVSQRPGLNRFVSGQKLFARNNIEINLTIKREMTLESPDTIIKVEFQPGDTAKDVYSRFTAAIDEYRRNPGGDFDNVAKIFNYIPGLLMKFFVWVLKVMDYFGILPRSLTKVSPFHGSLFITSMGSLGIPPVYHHLYDFGNLPIFLAFGAKQKKYELNADGEVVKRRFVDFTVMMDERICDGFYFASAMKYFRHILKKPQCLNDPPEQIIEDIE